MMKSMSLSRLATPAVAASAILFISVNIIANFWLDSPRLDATENQIYSTSDQVGPIFAGIQEPIVVRVYFSSRIGEVSPRHALYYQRVRDILKQYRALAGGLLNLEFYDPEPFSDVEDRAVGFGLQAVPLDELGEAGYFGLAATNATDDQKINPFFNLEREQFLEYDLAKLIYNLSNPSQPKVGLITSLPMDGGASAQPPSMGAMGGGRSPPWVIAGQVREFFQLETLSADLTEIPTDISVLMLVQPEGLSISAQYSIDQFVLRGGKAIVFVDPNVESGGPMGSAAGGSDLAGMMNLLSAWGVHMTAGQVVGDLESAMRVNMGAGGRPVISDYVAWLEIRQDNIDPSDAVTGDLNQLNFGTAGALEAVEGSQTVVAPLVFTSQQSMRIPRDKFVGMPDVIGLFRDFSSQGKREVLAVRVTGIAKSAFPEGVPDLVEADSSHVADSLQPIQVIVVSDTDVLTDRFWTDVTSFLGQQVAIPRADNATFVINALENLSGSSALSSLRGRVVEPRPFAFIENIRRDAEMQYRTTEQKLSARLDELESNMKGVQLRQDGEDAALLTNEDRLTIENYRGEILKTRRELREVQRALRQDIEGVEGVIKFLNIGAVPLVFGLVLVGLAVVRYRRPNSRFLES